MDEAAPETDNDRISMPAPYDLDLTPDEEQALWTRFAAEQLLKQYSGADEIYDQI